MNALRAAALALALAPLAADSLAASRADDEVRAEAAKIVDLFYGHDFEKAEPAAKALEERHPGHPAGPLFEAVVDYQRWVAEGLRDDGRWKSVDENLSRAIKLAKKMQKDDPAEAAYYEGAALGFRARGLAAQRKFVRAIKDASGSLRHLKQALALDPSLMDARLGLGMYHYFGARMPAAAKPFAVLLVGEPGNREQGLKELWSVAESTGIARMEARAVLSMILSKPDEAQWAQADKLLVELMTKYPRNPVYRLRRVYVAEKRGEWARACALADPDGKWLNSLHGAQRAPARDWAYYREAECRLYQGRARDAEKRLAALDEKRAPKGLGDWIRLRRANLLDLQGRRADAKQLYLSVDGREARIVAQAFLKKPFPDGPKDVAPYFAGY